jgi:hypothetical protein
MLQHLHNTSVLFALGLFQIGSPAFAQLLSDPDPSIYASQVNGITRVSHHTWSFMVL